jgi:hypothetical protein
MDERKGWMSEYTRGADWAPAAMDFGPFDSILIDRCSCEVLGTLTCTTFMHIQPFVLLFRNLLDLSANTFSIMKRSCKHSISSRRPRQVITHSHQSKKRPLPFLLPSVVLFPVLRHVTTPLRNFHTPLPLRLLTPHNPKRHHKPRENDRYHPVHPDIRGHDWCIM